MPSDIVLPDNITIQEKMVVEEEVTDISAAEGEKAKEKDAENEPTTSGETDNTNDQGVEKDESKGA